MGCYVCACYYLGGPISTNWLTYNPGLLEYTQKKNTHFDWLVKGEVFTSQWSLNRMELILPFNLCWHQSRRGGIQWSLLDLDTIVKGQWGPRRWGEEICECVFVHLYSKFMHVFLHKEWFILFRRKEKINVAVVQGFLMACSTEVSEEDLYAGSMCAVAVPASAQTDQQRCWMGDWKHI